MRNARNFAMGLLLCGICTRFSELLGLPLLPPDWPGAIACYGAVLALVFAACEAVAGDYDN